MKTFHHGGRIGDLVYALWTVKALGGGKLIVSDFHKPNWNLDVARSMESFLRYQWCVEDLEFVEFEELDLSTVDYDLHAAEDDHNPEAFGMTRDEPWPGRALIAGRYAKHFGLEFDSVPWLSLESMSRPPGLDFDIIMHVPDHRRVRMNFDWWDIRCGLVERGYSVIFSHGAERWLDIQQWSQLIMTAKVFVGCVSSLHAIAEGLGKVRLVEQADGCFNVGEPDVRLNGLSNDEVVAAVRRYL